MKYCASDLAFLNCRYSDKRFIESDEGITSVPEDKAFCNVPFNLFLCCDYANLDKSELRETRTRQREIYERLNLMPLFSEGLALRRELHEIAMSKYEHENCVSDYLLFLNNHECKFSVLEQGIFYMELIIETGCAYVGDCVEDCLDRAIADEVKT